MASSSAESVVGDEGLGSQVQDSSEIYDLANSIFEDYRQAKCLPNLEAAITLLREALDLRQVTRRRRSSVIHLASTMLAKFNCTDDIGDLDACIRVLAELFQDEVSQEGVEIEQDDESFRLTTFALDLVTAFDQATETSSLDTVIMLHRQALLLRDRFHEDRWESLNRLSAALVARYRHTGQLQDVEDAILILQEAISLQPYQVKLFVNLSGALITRFSRTNHFPYLRDAFAVRLLAYEVYEGAEREREAMRLCVSAINIRRTVTSSGQSSDLDTAISLWEEAISLLPPRSTHRPSFLELLAGAHVQRFNRTGEVADLDRSVNVRREVLELYPAPHLLRSEALAELADSIGRRFDATGKLTDLDEAVSLVREALDRVVTHGLDRVSKLRKLAHGLLTRFNRTGQLQDVAEAVSLYRQVLHLVPASQSDRFTSLNNLGETLELAYDVTSELSDLDEAVSVHRQSLSLMHPDRYISLDNLATTMARRANRTGRLGDLNEAVDLHREALSLLPESHSARPKLLDNFTTSMGWKYKLSSQLRDLDEAVLLGRECLNLLPEHDSERLTPLNNLAQVFFTKFERTARRADLEDAVSLYREALQLPAAAGRSQYRCLSNLATTLTFRFLEEGQLADLDESVALHRQGLELLSPSHSDRPLSLASLGLALGTRSNVTGQTVDLDESMLLYQEARRLLPTSHPHRPIILNNFSTALAMRFEKTGMLADLNEAESMIREALQLHLTSHLDRSLPLTTLATILSKRFAETKQLPDLDESLMLHQEVLDLLPKIVSHPGRARVLNNLATAYHRRYNSTHHLPDLERAIQWSRESLQGLPRDHPSYGVYLINQGDVIMELYIHTHGLSHLDDAVESFRSAVACEAVPGLRRLAVVRFWAQHANEARHQSALEAYQTAISLLPRLAMLGLDVQSRQQALASGSKGLACEAAACAIRLGQFHKATELLEQGRSVFWSQALNLRTPLDNLRLVPGGLELANKLENISRALEQGSLRDVSRNLLSETSQKVMSMEQETIRYRRLNDEWLATLAEIRRVEGFQNFLLPKSLSDLQPGLSSRMVVILNASQFGCAGLIITSGNVHHVPLPEIMYDEVKDLVRLLRILTTPHANLREGFFNILRGEIGTDSSLSSTGSRLGKRVPDIPLDSDGGFRLILAELWRSVVAPILRALNFAKSGTPPRLWWCPTGPFAFLPIHAAGIYDVDGSESVSDYIISSYTPTINALLTSVRTPSCNAKDFKVMVAIQPQRRGYASLPGTVLELARIQEWVPSHWLVKLGTLTAPASVEAVISHLPASSIVHFACHGQQNLRNPLESALVLHDGELKVSRIMEQSMPNASLAFLSACQTSLGDDNLPDEVIHLAATLLFAGFRGIVATMWSIADSDGPKVADAFYETLFSPVTSTGSVIVGCSPHPDPTNAALALHRAVIKLRSEHVSFQRWVPFVHFGL